LRFNESPLIDVDTVICTPGDQDATMVALDKLTGKTIWKSPMPGGADGGPSGPGGGRGGFGGGPGGSGAAYASAIAGGVR
jgi:outer membrane protein assembly factor BamB